jgi:hypothetical protein
VKLSPAIQTFIPAALPQKQGQALVSLPTSGVVLKRFTVIASSPDDNVMVVQADYADLVDLTPARLPAVTPKLISRDSPSAAPSASRSSSFLSPIQQYVRTQQSSDAIEAAPLVDVRA